jgi:sulfur carrier protein
MAFRINGAEVETNTDLTIGEFLRVRNISSERVVIEYNGEILPKDKFDFTKIKDGDNIEALSFVGGG